MIYFGIAFTILMIIAIGCAAAYVMMMWENFVYWHKDSIANGNRIIAEAAAKQAQYEKKAKAVAPLAKFYGCRVPIDPA